MKIYESYIVGMLRNFSTLPVDRIHDMLKMFVSTGEHKYDKKIGDLQLFLNQLCAEEKIETDGVLFSLPKNSKIITIGLAFSFQKYKKIPISKYDIKLNYILTEKGLY